MKILELPNDIKGKIIHGCYDCPFWDDGDSGYGSHCNLMDLKMDDISIPCTKYKVINNFLENCSLKEYQHKV